MNDLLKSGAIFMSILLHHSSFIFLSHRLRDTWEQNEASQVARVVKNPAANAGDIRVAGLIPGSGRSPGGGNDNWLQYSYLENPMDRGAWRSMVQRVAKSQIWLKWLGLACTKENKISLFFNTTSSFIALFLTHSIYSANTCWINEALADFSVLPKYDLYYSVPQHDLH